jgi:hypothetical protein
MPLPKGPRHCGVELYRDATSASRGFAFWRRDETDFVTSAD